MHQVSFARGDASFAFLQSPSEDGTVPQVFIFAAGSRATRLWHYRLLCLFGQCSLIPQLSVLLLVFFVKLGLVRIVVDAIFELAQVCLQSTGGHAVQGIDQSAVAWLEWSRIVA